MRRARVPQNFVSYVRAAESPTIAGNHINQARLYHVLIWVLLVAICFDLLWLVRLRVNPDEGRDPTIEIQKPSKIFAAAMELMIADLALLIEKVYTAYTYMCWTGMSGYLLAKGLDLYHRSHSINRSCIH
jgi:hypothetical protein